MGNVPPQKGEGHGDGTGGSAGDNIRGNRSQQHQQTHHRQYQQHQHSQQQSGYGGSGGVDYGSHGQVRNSHQRSISDHSMNSSPSAFNNQDSSSAMYSHSNNHHGGGSSGNTPSGINLDLLSLDDDTVPTVFRWEHGGRQVYITGTFNGWSRQIPMHRSGNDFTYIHNLKRGKHAFKFIVDDEWRFAPDQPTVADIEGRINNFIDVSDFTAYTGDKNFEDRLEGVVPCTPPVPSNENNAISAQSGAAIEPGSGIGTNQNVGGAPPSKDFTGGEEEFGNTMPDIDEYTKEPPPLPPHLRHIILNKPPQLNDTAALPVPQHVALNHLYCTAIKDNMMVLGVTQRYKTKFVTTVYYSPCAS